MVFLQLFSDWQMSVFHYFTCNECDFQPFQTCVIKILFSDDSNGGTRFMLQFKIAAICTSFYIQNIKICFHSQGVRFSISNISTFSRLILLVLIRFMLQFKMGSVSDLSLKSQDLQGPGGIMCDHLFNFHFVNSDFQGERGIWYNITNVILGRAIQYNIFLK